MKESNPLKVPAYTASLPCWATTLLIILTLAICLQGWWLYQLYPDSIADDSAIITPSDGPQPEPSAPALFQQPELLLPDPIGSLQWEPFGEIQSMREQIDRLFGDALKRVEQSHPLGAFDQFGFPISPRINVTENEKAYEVTVDLPGANDSKIDVTLEDQTLTIYAETEIESTNKDNRDGAKILRRERQMGRFQRGITFAQPVEAQAMTQKYENGVLHIRVPKKLQNSHRANTTNLGHPAA
jgi:HSP20 family protein